MRVLHVHVYEPGRDRGMPPSNHSCSIDERDAENDFERLTSTLKGLLRIQNCEVPDSPEEASSDGSP